MGISRSNEYRNMGGSLKAKQITENSDDGKSATRRLCLCYAGRPYLNRHISLCLYWNGQNLFVHQLWEFICDSGCRDVQCPRHVERNNYVPLFGVDPIECDLRYHVIRDVMAI